MQQARFLIPTLREPIPSLGHFTIRNSRHAVPFMFLNQGHTEYLCRCIRETSNDVKRVQGGTEVETLRFHNK